MLLGFGATVASSNGRLFPRWAIRGAATEQSGFPDGTIQSMTILSWLLLLADDIPKEAQYLFRNASTVRQRLSVVKKLLFLRCDRGSGDEPLLLSTVDE